MLKLQLVLPNDELAEIILDIHVCILKDFIFSTLQIF